MGLVLYEQRKLRTQIKPEHKRYTMAELLRPASARVMEAVRANVMEKKA